MRRSDSCENVKENRVAVPLRRETTHLSTYSIEFEIEPNGNGIW